MPNVLTPDPIAEVNTSERTESVRIAAWSGPRNVSTALMRSFEARGDTAVVDEPLYACYLDRTGLEHPMRDEVLASQPTDWRQVFDDLSGPIPGGQSIYYQKHMAHHLSDDMDLSSLDGFRHMFLIREPRGMLASLRKKLGAVEIEDTGYPQQIRLFRRLREESGSAPPVVDARDVRTDPPRVLRALCERLEIPYTDSMLEWAPGRRKTDGVWAAHWYDAVEKSTGFAPFNESASESPSGLESLEARCQEIHDELAAFRIR